MAGCHYYSYMGAMVSCLETSEQRCPWKGCSSKSPSGETRDTIIAKIDGDLRPTQSYGTKCAVSSIFRNPTSLGTATVGYTELDYH